MKFKDNSVTYSYDIYFSYDLFASQGGTVEQGHTSCHNACVHQHYNGPHSMPVLGMEMSKWKNSILHSRDTIITHPTLAAMGTVITATNRGMNPRPYDSSDVRF